MRSSVLQATDGGCAQKLKLCLYVSLLRRAQIIVQESKRDGGRQLAPYAGDMWYVPCHEPAKERHRWVV